MKTMMKKLSALLMAAIMVLAMSATAFAAISGASVTVKGLSTNGKQSVTIYEIYHLDANDNAWEKAAWVPETIAPENLTSEDSLAALVAAATNATGTTQETETGSVTFNDLQVGAYLVMAVDENGKVVYNPMVAVTGEYDETTNLITAKDATVVAKANTFTTDKKQEDNDEVVEVGDLVKYSITTTVPYTTNEKPVTKFTVSDKLTGATYYLSGEAVKGVEAVNEITVNGKPSGLEIPAEAQDKNIFTVDLKSLIDNENTNAGATVVITYTAKVTAVDEVTNKALSTHDSDGTTVTAYTGQAEITKYASDETPDNLQDNKVLSGAEFAIYRMTEDDAREYAIIDDNGYITGEWIKVPADEDGNFTRPDGISTVVTNAEGIAVVKGLNVGTYHFDEVVAPDGYAITEEDSEVTVSKDNVEGKVTVFGSTYMIDSKLSSLPSTGGIGTTIFTIGGCVIMIVAAGLYFTYRRKAK